VRELLSAELAALAGVAEEQGENHNVFLEAISPTIAAASKLTRSLTSRLGGRFAAIARSLAKARFGEAAVPRVLLSHSANPEAVTAAFGGDTTIYTQFDEGATRELAIRLVRQAGADVTRKIGTDPFRAAFRSSVRQLGAAPRTERPWSVRVDLYVDSDTIGLVELESGGELDTANVKGQPEKLVLAGLALGVEDVPLHFALAYANRGEGQPVAGGLPKYLARSGAVRPLSGLLVGSEWWLRILPEGVAFAQFLEVFREVAEELKLVPDDLRRADRAIET
jgi:hypothetical protein